MPVLKEYLTHEYLKGLFKNNFDLTNSAIKLARYYVKSGHEVNIDQLLDKIRRNPKQLELELMTDEEDAK
jgi:hypothetical protein